MCMQKEELTIRSPPQTRESQLIPQVRTEVRQVVEVEARVHRDGRRDNVVPDVTPGSGNVGPRGQFGDGWEVQCVVHEVEVAAFLCPFVDRGHEGFVEREDGGVFV